MDIAVLGIEVKSGGVSRATRRLQGMDGAAKSVTDSLSDMAKVLTGVLATAFSLRNMFAFQNGIAEVSTLVDTATFSMGKLTDAALEQASTYGNLQGQVAAYYQIVSAGAGTVAEATSILDASNKLAIGGVTDIATAADVLTSILNAYGDKVESAIAVSDALFVGMRAGKTTIGELSGALGRVAPLAAQTGVGFGELTAAVSALAKGGMDTRVAVTGVRAILAAVVKPTSEAAKMAEQLGIQFDAAALESKGLAGFLDTLVEASGGSAQQLAQLFGGVEALVPMMALAGQAGEDFADIMVDMAEKAKATQDAFDKMSATAGFQSQRMFTSLAVEALKLAGGLSESLVPAMAYVADRADMLPVVLAAIAGTMTVVLIPSIVSATVAFGALTLAMVTNPFAQLAVVAGTLAGMLVYLSKEQEDARQAAQSHAEALTTTANAIEIAKTSSQQFRDTLRKQTEDQLEAANAALTEAYAQAEAMKIKAQAANLFGATMEALGQAMGMDSVDPNYGAGIMADYDAGIDVLRERIFEIQDKLSELAQVEKDFAPVETVVHTLSTSLAAANDNAKKLQETIKEGEAVFDASRTVFENYGLEIQRLDGLLAQGAISWETYGRAASMATAVSAGQILGSLASLSGGLSQAFEENKALSIATAVLKGAESVASAFAAGNAIGGPPVGAIYAGVAAITAAANVATVASVGQNSKTISRAGGGGSAPPVSNQPQQPARTVNVSFEGSSPYKENIEDLIERLNEALGDGATINMVA